MTPARTLARACAFYGSACVAQALAHVAHVPRVTLRAGDHRAYVVTSGAERIGRGELRALCAAIPGHLERCEACAALISTATPTLTEGP